ncbi:MAG: hypothetical protein L3J63_02645, partial [Geopsychrobacter sp.]|nr:hypothetical protein [Geopsychrobacter sp.]
RSVIVLPALCESRTIVKALESLAQNPVALLSQTLVIVVVNQGEATKVVDKVDNQKTLNWLACQSLPHMNLCWVDATTPGLEFAPKEGVGLARKLGFDLALGRIDWSCDPLFISLDADTLVDENYLAAIFEHFNTTVSAGAYIPFRHQTGSTAVRETAIRLYELYLRSYLFGLQWAGSPYAFTALGSAFACRAKAYVSAGGMKRRQAGEDFYFLQQLVKTGGVSLLQGTVVRPAARYSERVPFGTGRAIEAEVAGEQRRFQFISFSAFRQLRDWLSLVSDEHEADAAELLVKAAQISPCLSAYLEELGFAQAWQNIQRQTSRDKFLVAWHQWFDGLRTRQLLKCLDEEREEVDPQVLVTDLLCRTVIQSEDGRAAPLPCLEQLQGVPPVQ